MAKINFKLSKQAQQMLVAGILGTGGFGYSYYAFFWAPVSKSISDAQKETEEVDAKIEKATRQAARLPRLEKELVDLNQQAVEAERRLPKKKSTPEILVTVSELAERYHVMLLNFTPGGASSRATFTELNYPVTIKGQFHNIGKFLAALSLEERIFNVSNVMYSAPSGDTGEMQVTFTLVSYQYKG